VVESLLTEGTALGSAVAVTQTELLTNCHVIENARKIILKRDKKEWVARLGRSDPATDRCVLTVSEPILVPIQGVRTWNSLEIGEAAYALGSPAGLELSLSSGIVSGRREEEKLKLVQTTAPISPGSSGGGLFDARGNLIGITTLVIAGRERLNQALNFAIPAERFWTD
jgi:S1-C subfamily serine protease